MSIDFSRFCFYILFRYTFWYFSTFRLFFHTLKYLSISSIHLFATPGGFKMEGQGVCRIGIHSFYKKPVYKKQESRILIITIDF